MSFSIAMGIGYYLLMIRIKPHQINEQILIHQILLNNREIEKVIFIRILYVFAKIKDMEKETFSPMTASLGNHYIVVFNHDDAYYALDSWKTPGKKALSKLSTQQIEDHLYHTYNAIYAVSLKGQN